MGRVAKESAKVKAHIRYKTQDGHTVPGVTTVTGILNKPALLYWAWNLGMEKIDYRTFRDDKADIGTLAHQMVTDYLSGKKTDTSDYSANQISSAENAVLSFHEWEKTNRIEEVLFVERPLVSEVHRFGGTMDIYCVVAGLYELIDLKTGKGIYEEMAYQVAAYRELLREHGNTVDRVRILNIPRTEDEDFIEKILSLQELETGWQVFLHCLAIYNLKKKERR